MIECLLCVRHLTRLEGKNDAIGDRAPEGPVRKQVKGCSETKQRGKFRAERGTEPVVQAEGA